MGMSMIGNIPGVIAGQMPQLPGGAQLPGMPGPGPGIGIGMDYRDLLNQQDPNAQLNPQPDQNIQGNQPAPSMIAPPVAGLPTTGIGGGKGIGGMLPDIIAGQMPQLPGGGQFPGMPLQGQLVGGPAERPIFNPTPQLPGGQMVGGPAGRPIFNPGNIGIQGGPVNRFAPPNAPGVRTALPGAPVSATNMANARTFAPRPFTRPRVR